MEKKNQYFSIKVDINVDLKIAFDFDFIEVSISFHILGPTGVKNIDFD